MFNNKKTWLVFLCMMLLLPAIGLTQSPDQEEWRSLFNGTDLSGWDIKITGEDLNVNYLNTFVVEDSILRIQYGEYEKFGNKFGHLYYQEPFSYYKLRVQYRFVGEQTPGGASWNVRNSGVMFHSQSAKSVEFDQHFPVSLEMQFLGGLDEGPRSTNNLCTPGTFVEMDGKQNFTHCINSESDTYHGDQWVWAEAVVYGDSLVIHLVENDTVLSYEHPMIDSVFVHAKFNNWEQAGMKQGDHWRARFGERLKSGYIALQAESHPIDFRRVELLNLEGCMDPKALNYKSYYVKANNESCRY